MFFASVVVYGTDESNLFVAQAPVPSDFTTIGSTFGNQLPTLARANAANTPDGVFQ